MYHGECWHKDDRFLAPMLVHQETGEHIYAGDVVLLKGDHISAKVVKFFTISETDTEGNQKVTYMADIFQILPPSMNTLYQCYALLAECVCIECSTISHVITDQLPFTFNEIKLQTSSTEALRSLTEEVRVNY